MKKTILLISALVCLLNSCNKEDASPTTTEKPITYSNFKITSVKINNIPFTDGNGSSWDVSSGPDVYFRLTDKNDTEYTKGTQYNDILSSNLPFGWNFTKAFEINNLNTTFFVEIYDHDDLDSDDLIGIVGFNASYFTNGYPTSIPLSNSGCDIVINGTWY